jgi:hypothetical protein
MKIPYEGTRTVCDVCHRGCGQGHSTTEDLDGNEVHLCFHFLPESSPQYSRAAPKMKCEDIFKGQQWMVEQRRKVAANEETTAMLLSRAAELGW